MPLQGPMQTLTQEENPPLEFPTSAPATDISALDDSVAADFDLTFSPGSMSPRTLESFNTRASTPATELSTVGKEIPAEDWDPTDTESVDTASVFEEIAISSSIHEPSTQPLLLLHEAVLVLDEPLQSLAICDTETSSSSVEEAESAPECDSDRTMTQVSGMEDHPKICSSEPADPAIDETFLEILCELQTPHVEEIAEPEVMSPCDAKFDSEQSDICITQPATAEIEVDLQPVMLPEEAASVDITEVEDPVEISETIPIVFEPAHDAPQYEEDIKSEATANFHASVTALDELAVSGAIACATPVTPEDHRHVAYQFPSDVLDTHAQRVLVNSVIMTRRCHSTPPSFGERVFTFHGDYSKVASRFMHSNHTLLATNRPAEPRVISLLPGLLNGRGHGGSTSVSLHGMSSIESPGTASSSHSMAIVKMCGEANVEHKMQQPRYNSTSSFPHFSGTGLSACQPTVRQNPRQQMQAPLWMQVKEVDVLQSISSPNLGQLSTVHADESEIQNRAGARSWSFGATAATEVFECASPVSQAHMTLPSAPDLSIPKSFKTPVVVGLPNIKLRHFGPSLAAGVAFSEASATDIQGNPPSKTLSASAKMTVTSTIPTRHKETPSNHTPGNRVAYKISQEMIKPVKMGSNYVDGVHPGNAFTNAWTQSKNSGSQHLDKFSLPDISQSQKSWNVKRDGVSSASAFGYSFKHERPPSSRSDGMPPINVLQTNSGKSLKSFALEHSSPTALPSRLSPLGGYLHSGASGDLSSLRQHSDGGFAHP